MSIMSCHIKSQRNRCLEKTGVEYKEIHLIQEVPQTIKEIKQLSLLGRQSVELLNNLSPSFLMEEKEKGED